MLMWGNHSSFCFNSLNTDILQTTEHTKFVHICAMASCIPTAVHSPRAELQALCRVTSSGQALGAGSSKTSLNNVAHYAEEGTGRARSCFLHISGNPSQGLGKGWRVSSCTMLASRRPSPLLPTNGFAGGAGKARQRGSFSDNIKR